jgi:hypothetical protein
VCLHAATNPIMSCHHLLIVTFPLKKRKRRLLDTAKQRLPSSPIRLHCAIIYKNDSVIQLIASPPPTPCCFRGPYPAVTPESACDLDDDGLQCLIQQLVWHWGSPAPASCHPHQAVCLAVQGRKARGLKTRAHTQRGQF